MTPYEAMKNWIAENGYTPTGTVYEMYLNDPRQEPKQEPQTLIAMAVRAAGG